jgi:8-oxo-dGTP diphosphatase
MAARNFLAPPAWHASLPGVVVAASALIGDGAGNVLIVKPNYRAHWTLPGGMCEFGEAPHAGCAREISEELGLELPVGPLLAVDWQLPLARYGPAARPAIYFVFDGGTVSGQPQITLQQEELDGWRFAAESELASYLPPQMLPRASAALAAKAAGCPRYVPGRHVPRRHAPGRPDSG